MYTLRMHITPIHPRRFRIAGSQAQQKTGPVIYWMSRDQRVYDNWALTHAQHLAYSHHQPVVVVFALTSAFLGARTRQYDFLLTGLEEVHKQLSRLRIPLYILEGNPPQQVSHFAKHVDASCVVTDFSPLRIKRQWEGEYIKNIDTPLHVVDAHNIIPCWHASDKQEYGAYTIRPKIHKHLDEFKTLPPNPCVQDASWPYRVPQIDWRALRRTHTTDTAHKLIGNMSPGPTASLMLLQEFIKHTLEKYSLWRNDPTKDGSSNLSPYLHFGHISASRVLHEIEQRKTNALSKAMFLEELIVRRELADNYCWYNRAYDNSLGFPSWAIQSHDVHRTDQRDYVYTQDQFEQATTHDPLWNAAQAQMVHTGKMHGYMRMYWAKKILEWTHDVHEAMRIAIYLNDTYELDGRDPNGYAGIAWSLGGVHDRPWFTRPIFGKIRYMNESGARKKFDVDTYIRRYTPPDHSRDLSSLSKISKAGS